MANKNSPLRIGAVAAGSGEIGMTFCPGKKQVGALSGDWNRNLAEDLDVITEWGASAVVSVITSEELHALKVPQLGQEVERRGLDWYHLPVHDGGVPDAGFEDYWTYAGHRLRSLLHSTGV
jgi:ADP-ribosyl-[dinitrogen reductase] hydrolase